MNLEEEGLYAYIFEVTLQCPIELHAFDDPLPPAANNATCLIKLGLQQSLCLTLTNGEPYDANALLFTFW
jgi:hypothetical protein